MHAHNYHRQELPQVSFVSRQSTSFVAHIFLSRQNLSRENYVCRDKHVFCRDKHVFCHDKHVFYRDKSMLGVTKLTCLSRQKYFSRQSTEVLSRQACFCRDKWHLWNLQPVIHNYMHYAARWGSQFCLRTGDWCFHQYWIIAVVWYVLRWP